MKTQYAIKVMLSVDDWIYITEDCKANPWNLRVRTFSSREEAEKWAEQTGWLTYKVVRYRKDKKDG